MQQSRLHPLTEPQESWRKNLTNQPAFLVALTRSVDKFRLYTDDKSRLLETLCTHTGSKIASHDVVEKQVLAAMTVGNHDAQTMKILSGNLPAASSISAVNTYHHLGEIDRKLMQEYQKIPTSPPEVSHQNVTRSLPARLQKIRGMEPDL